MKHNRLATALVVTGSVLGLAACSWFGGDDNKQASSQGYSSQSYSAPSSASNSGASGSYSSNSGSAASTQTYSGSSSMSSNVGSSRTSGMKSGSSSSEIADVQQHLQQLGYYKGRIDGVWGKQSRQAMAQFQRSQGMTATGQIDDQSKQALNSGSTSRSATATGSSGISGSSSRAGSSNLNSSSSMDRNNDNTGATKSGAYGSDAKNSINEPSSANPSK